MFDFVYTPLFSVLLSSVFALFIGLLVWGVIIPYLKVSSFKRPDADVQFLPFLGHLWYVKRDFLEKGDAKSEAKSFRENFPNHRLRVTNFGTSPVLLLRDEQLIKEYAKNIFLYDRTSLVQVFKVMIGNGLVYSQGEIWKQHRKVISGAFNYDFVKDSIPLIQNTAKEFLDKITAQDMQDYPILSKAAQITGEVAGRFFFGEKLSSYTVDGKPITVELNELITEIGTLEQNPLTLVFGARILDIPLNRFRSVKQRAKRFRKVCAKIIADRRSSSELGNDLLGRLLTAQMNDCEQQQLFTDEGIIDEFATVFMVGMDTTAHVIGMLMYSITKHPEYHEELKKERAAAYNEQGKLTPESLQKMDLLHAMCKETLRLYSPFPFMAMRKCISDHVLGDIPIKKGCYVEADLLSTLFDGKIFKNPREFNPDRWRDPNFTPDTYSYIPFGGGPRNCVGQHLALMEVKVVVSELLNRFEPKLKDDAEVKFKLTGLYEPEKDIPLELTRID